MYKGLKIGPRLAWLMLYIEVMVLLPAKPNKVMSNGVSHKKNEEDLSQCPGHSRSAALLAVWGKHHAGSANKRGEVSQCVQRQ